MEAWPKISIKYWITESYGRCLKIWTGVFFRSNSSFNTLQTNHGIRIGTCSEMSETLQKMMSVLLNLERNILSFPPSNQSATRWHRFAVGNQQKAKVLLGWASGITSTIRQILSYIYISADPGWCKGERTREEEEQLQCQSLQRTTATTKNQQQPTASNQQPVACCQQMKHFFL